VNELRKKCLSAFVGFIALIFPHDSRGVVTRCPCR
jgi:hypothetical protein